MSTNRQHLVARGADLFSRPSTVGTVTNSKGNQVLACYACNQAKGDMDPRLILRVWLRLDAAGFHHALQRIASCLPQPVTTRC